MRLGLESPCVYAYGSGSLRATYGVQWGQLIQDNAGAWCPLSLSADTASALFY